MKIRVMLLLVCLGPLACSAISRRGGGTRVVLHSIFDAQPPKASLVENDNGRTMQWRAALQYSPYRGDGSDKVGTGITLMFLGALCLIGGCFAIAAGDRQSYEANHTPGASTAFAGFGNYFLGVIGIGGGCGLFFPGLAITIRYSSGGGSGRWWR